MDKSVALSLVIAFSMLLAGCTKVSKLSDDAEIVSFKITRVSDGVELGVDQIVVNNNEVLIPLEFGRKNFPLAISTEIGFSKTTDEAMSIDEQQLNLKEFVFNDVYTAKEFYLIAESGTPHLARVKLVDKLNAEITGFDPELDDPDAVLVTVLDNNIRILLKKALGWPLTITPTVTKTATAEYLDYQEGDSFTFTSVADNQKQITLCAANGDERIWNIQVVPLIQNSDFELWINEGNKSVNIDPVPGSGLGWATANNSFVQGTKPVVHDGGKAAQMTTELQSIGFLGDMIASGTIFTGKFKLSVSALNNPPAMTHFGIPFVSKPVSISVDASYISGSQLQQSVKEGDKYVLHNLTGADEGRIWVKLLHWEGEGDIDYHEKPVEGLTILGEGEMIFDGNKTSLRDWKRYTIPINYYSSYRHLNPTHLAIVMTSSRRGDSFIGAVGSKLTVDNVEVNF